MRTVSRQKNEASCASYVEVNARYAFDDEAVSKVGVFDVESNGTVFWKPFPQCKMQQWAKFPIHV